MTKLGRMKLEAWKLEDLKHPAFNPRAIKEKNAERLGGSLDEFGLVQPIVVNRKTGDVLGGNQRLEQLRARGVETTDVVVVELDDARARALCLALNNPRAQGHFTAEGLGMLRDLESALPDLVNTTGLAELGKDFAKAFKKTASDEAVEVAPPEPPERPITQPGDVWRLGPHRLMCGDSTKPEDVARLMGDERAAAIVTDPPYAIYGSSTGIASDITDDKMVRPFFRDVLEASTRVLRSFGHLYACCDWRSWSSWWEVAKGTGFAPKNMIVWDKGGGLGGMYANAHELLFFASLRPMRRAMTQKIAGERNVAGSNVWRIGRANLNETGGQREHNAQKPIALFAKAIEGSTDAGELVVDLFIGSGTAIAAAEQTGRVCYGMEVAPAYCDVAVARWEKLTGKKATREGQAPTKKKTARRKKAAKKKTAKKKPAAKKSAAKKGAKK